MFLRLFLDVLVCLFVSPVSRAPAKPRHGLWLCHLLTLSFPVRQSGKRVCFPRLNHCRLETDLVKSASGGVGFSAYADFLLSVRM
jgi:hypothetical protein